MSLSSCACKIIVAQYFTNMLQYFIIINLHKICQTVYVIPKSLQKVLRKEFYVKGFT
ncbi:hypothetical protein AYR72_gp024 [Cnaphalocrocis medinalis granulovirus]|uniref:Uncharacterized protein n=1 Tax=Cnaphalocrocis medinalis granulovirus TaxID=1750712 RepID=A0A109WZS2_9BBAC|nr:hypothetical protein AYR72_gp024 [Cnaphalocrocis medinalis granulovirus]